MIMTKKLIKVIYLSSSEFDEGLKTELMIDDNQLVAIEIYNNGEYRYVVIRDGMINYILSGENKK